MFYLPVRVDLDAVAASTGSEAATARSTRGGGAAHPHVGIRDAPQSRPQCVDDLLWRASSQFIDEIRGEVAVEGAGPPRSHARFPCDHRRSADADRKSTRLNSSHVKISYAVFCLKKKKQTHESQ